MTDEPVYGKPGQRDPSAGTERDARKALPHAYEAVIAERKPALHAPGLVPLGGHR